MRQQVNKRSIDDDVKEFFAIKNLAHFQYEIESKKNFNAKGAFGGTISNIEKSFDSHMGNDERLSSMRQVFGKRMNRKSGLGIAIPNPNDPNVMEFAGESPQVNMTIQHTDPHVGEVGGSLNISPRSVDSAEKEQKV